MILEVVTIVEEGVLISIFIFPSESIEEVTNSIVEVEKSISSIVEDGVVVEIGVIL